MAAALSEIGREVPGATVTLPGVGTRSVDVVRSAGRLMDEVRVEHERIVLVAGLAR
ncbi:hypothetical protein [Dactylosporangium sp. CA-233914]|uniref:hypothetical protein n=1 Tax=Dactylosporangium sp. CA-233914 TaxID=3239934 RepID=UPI003D8C3F2D